MLKELLKHLNRNFKISTVKYTVFPFFRYEFAFDDPHRAVTNNKGVMNGINGLSPALYFPLLADSTVIIEEHNYRGPFPPPWFPHFVNKAGESSGFPLIDAAAVALGQDWRAFEGAAHAHQWISVSLAALAFNLRLALIDFFTN